jgi:hypothetical protein
MTRDPLGHYARLGVTPEATPEELKAAFHAKARRLHPDVPGTGDAAAFVRLKEAYDTLSNPLRRAAYHRAASITPAPPPRPPRPPQPPRPMWWRSPWLAVIAVSGIAAIVALVAMVRVADPGPQTPAVAAKAPEPSPAAPAAPTPPTITAASLAGTPDHYILPGGEPATLWRGDQTGHALAPAGRLPAYTTVHVPELPAPDGLMPVALTGGAIGYVDATRLMPGDALTARREACADNSGRPPANGEVLAGGGGGGDARATLANASISPAVVTLIDSAGRRVVRIYLAPRGAARVAGLAPGPWTTEIAFGELWSRGCSAFVAGSRVLRPAGTLPSGGVLAIGPQAPNG